MAQKIISNKDFDKKLFNKNPNIIRVGDYFGARLKTNFKCKVCNYLWASIAGSITSGSGCPNCAGVVKLTNEIVDQRLIGRNIKRISDIITARTLTNWQCLVDECNYIWKTSATHIFDSSSGCPKCAGNIKLTNSYIDNKLIGRNIKRIEDYSGNKENILWQCLIDSCNYQWKTSTLHILYNNSGCPKCGGTFKLTNKEVDQRLIGRNIKRLENYININTVILWQCLLQECNHKWKATPDNIINKHTGCPNCCVGKNEKLVGNTLDILGIKYIRQFKIPTSAHGNWIDYFLCDHNLFIEYNGEQHYRPVKFGRQADKAIFKFEKQKIRDENVRKYCLENNINLLEIDGRKYKDKKLEKYIIEYFTANYTQLIKNV